LAIHWSYVCFIEQEKNLARAEREKEKTMILTFQPPYGSYVNQAPCLFFSSEFVCHGCLSSVNRRTGMLSSLLPFIYVM
jgi:hypothetical protein